MNNIVRWDLFGECIYEELNFEKIPEYVKDDYNETIAAYTNWKEDGSFSISELVRDIFYVSILSEIAPPTNIDDISRMTKNYGSTRMSGNYFCHCVESQIKQNLDVVDKINGYVMEKFKFECYRAKKKINEINSLDEDIEDRKNIQKFFWILDDCYSGNQHNLYDELKKIPIRDESMRDLTEMICEGVGDYCDQEYIYELFWEWINKDNFINNKSKFEMKRRLLKDLLKIINEIESLCPWGWKQIPTQELINGFVFDNKYAWGISRFMNILNDAVVSIQRTICNLSVTQSSNFKDNLYVNTVLDIIKKNNSHILKSCTCFAIMKNLSTNQLYFSISGIDWKDNTYKKVTSALKKAEYERIRLIPEVRYWFQKNENFNKEVVTFKQCENIYKENTKFERMFSCCERKLLVSPESDATYVIYVRWNPCYMCMDDLEYILQNNMTKGVQIYFGEELNQVTDRQLYDRLAETAWMYEKRIK